MNYFVYILECSDGTYYTGMTTNLKRRFSRHKNGSDKRAYTYSRRPVELVWCELLQSKDEAKLREKQIKRWSKKKKESTIREHTGDFEMCQ